MNVKINCPVCDLGPMKINLSTKDYFLTEDNFDLYTCQNCSYTMTFPVPSLEKLPKYYKSENYLSHTASKKGFINSIYQYLRSINLTNKYALIAKYSHPGDILDIGCGTGELLDHFKKNKWKVTGIEPNNEAREYANKQYNVNAKQEHELIALPEKHFDVITMWHVLEHVPDFNERIKQIQKLIKPSGTIFIAVPNIKSPDAIKYGKHWAGLDVPRHLHHFSPQSFKKLSDKHNLGLLEMVPMKMDAFYVSLLSEKYLKHSLPLLRAFIEGLKSNIEASKNNSYSSMIFVLKPK